MLSNFFLNMCVYILIFVLLSSLVWEASHYRGQWSLIQRLITEQSTEEKQLWMFSCTWNIFIPSLSSRNFMEEEMERMEEPRMRREAVRYCLLDLAWCAGEFPAAVDTCTRSVQDVASKHHSRERGVAWVTSPSRGAVGSWWCWEKGCRCPIVFFRSVTTGSLLMPQRTNSPSMCI